MAIRDVLEGRVGVSAWINEIGIRWVKLCGVLQLDCSRQGLTLSNTTVGYHDTSLVQVCDVTYYSNANSIEGHEGTKYMKVPSLYRAIHL